MPGGFRMDGFHADKARPGDLHGYATRSARVDLAVTARSHQMVGNRVPKYYLPSSRVLLRRSRGGG